MFTGYESTTKQGHTVTTRNASNSLMHASATVPAAEYNHSTDALERDIVKHSNNNTMSVSGATHQCDCTNEMDFIIKRLEKLDVIEKLQEKVNEIGKDVDTLKMISECH